MLSPRPVPLPTSLVVKNGSKARVSTSGAMPTGGSLTIAGANAQAGAASIEPAPGDYVALSVVDTGIGMSAEVAERAFEPFFTTKESGKGTGLGLSMVYGFVKQIGGHVEIESAVGAGTTVQLHLPRAKTQELKQPPSDQPPETGRLSFSVLLVEDNVNIRAMTAARLQELGARVIEADNAPAALETIRSEASIDVLFTDVVMPGGMSGLELANRARELRPGIKVVLASGYAALFPTTGGVVGELLQKPYRDEDLLRVLKKTLDVEPGAVAAPPTALAEGVVATPTRAEYP